VPAVSPASPERSKGTTKIARLRTQLDISQEELAVATGISVATLHRIETGEHENPTVRQIYAIAWALGVAPGKLIEPGWMQQGVRRLTAPD
jgi:transcriptional regulator with XRE-family HTH domain